MLKRLPLEEYRLFIMDGDVIGGLSDMPLTHWIQNEDARADLIFYEREWNFGMCMYLRKIMKLLLM